MISSVSFGLPQENLVTSTIYSIKPQIMEEVCEVGYKNCEKKFGLKHFSQAQIVFHHFPV